MGIIQTSTNTKSSKNRYSGQDSVPWKVAYTVPPTVKVKEESFASFTEADNAARQYTDATGLPAAAARV